MKFSILILSMTLSLICLAEDAKKYQPAADNDSNEGLFKLQLDFGRAYGNNGDTGLSLIGSGEAPRLYTMIGDGYFLGALAPKVSMRLDRVNKSESIEGELFELFGRKTDIGQYSLVTLGYQTNNGVYKNISIAGVAIDLLKIKKEVSIELSDWGKVDLCVDVHGVVRFGVQEYDKNEKGEEKDITLKGASASGCLALSVLDSVKLSNKFSYASLFGEDSLGQDVTLENMKNRVEISDTGRYGIGAFYEYTDAREEIGMGKSGVSSHIFGVSVIGM